MMDGATKAVVQTIGLIVVAVLLGLSIYALAKSQDASHAKAVTRIQQHYNERCEGMWGDYQWKVVKTNRDYHCMIKMNNRWTPAENIVIK
jgi:hypothetical protein